LSTSVSSAAPLDNGPEIVATAAFPETNALNRA